MRHERQYFPGGWLFEEVYLKFYLKKAQNNHKFYDQNNHKFYEHDNEAKCLLTSYTLLPVH